MKFIIKRLFEVVILSIISTLFARITPLSVGAMNDFSPCPTISLAPVDGVYDMLPKYDEPQVPDEQSVLNEARECIHNFTKSSEKNNVEPSITVLTHGLGGNPSHWSNNNIIRKIEYDTESIIERIRDLDVANTDVFMIENVVPGKTKNAFKIMKLNIDSSKKIYTSKEVDFSTNDLGRKVVIIFKSSDYWQQQYYRLS